MKRKNSFKKAFVLFLEFLKIGLKNLARQRTRTILTSGAITIGVVLIIFMVALGMGVNDWLIEQISGQLDITTVIVMSNQAANRPGARQLFQDESTETSTSSDLEEESPMLTKENVEAFYDIPHVEEVTPVVMITADVAKIEGIENLFYSPFVSAMPLKQDDPYINEVKAGDPTVVNNDPDKVILTTMMLRNVEGFEESYDSLIGKKITLTIPTKVAPTGFYSTTVEAKDIEFEIASVIDIGFDNNHIMINLDKTIELLAEATEQTSEEFLNETGYFTVMVKTDSAETTEEVANVIEELGFVTSTTEDILQMINDVLKVVQISLSSFGIIALVVATLGIANTMVMSIYERTREIGIMKAIGASKGNIRTLFLIEASLIGTIGGIGGLVISYPLTLAGNLVLSNYLSGMGIPNGSGLFTLPIWLGAGALIFSTLIATMAGIYPSHKAAKLDPIKAIRYE